MNKWEKEVLQSQLNDEQHALRNIEAVYKKALKDIDDKIAVLKGRTDTENLQSIVYQLDYQNALKKQINGILDTMHGEQFTTISDYLTKCYDEGYLGTMYDLHGQGIPLIMPIDQEQVTRAVLTESKISEGLYKRLGEDVNKLKRRIANNISRGIAQGSSYSQMAKNIRGLSNVPLNNAYRIARTEGHRITNAATFDAQQKAKDKGADIVKQWDSTLDSRTRPHHAQLDGQIRELEEPFEVAGRKAMHPGGFGVPEEDIHCRCAMLQRARWALDEDELKELQERAEFFGLDKTDSFEEFKTKYIEAIKVDPNEGKVFHMLPDGTLVEGEIPGKNKYYLNGLTGEVTELEKGIDYSSEILSLNDDGTYSFGKVKNAAQYKVNLDNKQVLNLDVQKAVDDYVSVFGDDFDEAAKFRTLYNSLPKDLTDEISKVYSAYGGAATLEDVTYQVIKNNGYSGIHIVSNGKYFDDFLKIFDDSLVKKTKKSKLETLTSSLATQQKKLAKIDNKTYSGIWEDDVQVSDYAVKKGSIQGKRDYYTEQIEKAKQYLDSGFFTAEEYNNSVVKFQKYLDDLDEFEKLGIEYEKIDTKIKKIQADIKKYTPKTAASGDAFSQERKDNAYWFTDKNGSTRGADNVLRDKCGEVWRNAPLKEKEAIYGYTNSYSKINEPLRGIEYGTNKYLGVGNVDLNMIGVNGYGGYKPGQVKAQIDAMTDIIDKSSYDFDIWVNRGVRYNGMDKFFGIDTSDFYLSESELSAKLVGTTPTEYGFMSTGVAKGKGFGGDIKLNIFCPEGTKMMYAEPFSAFGNGDGWDWDGVAKQSSFGSESEMILQRGTQFRVTKVERSGGTWYIDMDVIGQSPPAT